MCKSSSHLPDEAEVDGLGNKDCRSEGNQGEGSLYSACTQPEPPQAHASGQLCLAWSLADERNTVHSLQSKLAPNTTQRRMTLPFRTRRFQKLLVRAARRASAL